MAIPSSLRRWAGHIVAAVMGALIVTTLLSIKSVIFHESLLTLPPIASGCRDCATSLEATSSYTSPSPLLEDSHRGSAFSTPIPFSNVVRRPFRFHVYDIPAKYIEGALTLLESRWQVSSCNRKQNFTMVDWRHAKSLFTADVFIARYLKLHPSHTSNPDEADAFIIPMMTHVYDCAGLQQYMIEILAWVTQQRKKYYAAHNQHDHFLFWWRWGMNYNAVNRFWKRFKAHFSNANLISFDYLELQGRNYWQDFSLGLKPHYLQYQHAIIVPYPDFSPMLQQPVTDIHAKREIFFYFAGTTKIGGIRRFIDRTCAEHPLDCEYEGFGTGVLDKKRLATPDAAKKMRNSLFCGHAQGDALSSRRPTQAVLAGCIPVLICDLCLYAWENFIDYASFAVFVPEDAVMNGKLFDILRAISPARIEEMQRNLNQVRKHFVFHSGVPEEGDALDMIVKQLELRGLIYRQHRRWFRSNPALSSKAEDYPVDPPSLKRYVRDWNKDDFNGLGALKAVFEKNLKG